MDNPFEIFNERLERIEFLLEKLVSETTVQIINKNNVPKSKMPTDEEMDAYLLQNVFSIKQ
jgi:hypothetical protein